MKKLRQWMKWAAAAALGLLLCACLTRPAGAAISKTIPVVTGEPCHLTLNFKDPGVTFYLYRVASVDANVRFTTVPAIANDSNFPAADFNGITSASQWNDLATTIHPYLERYFTPLRTGVTDASGTLTFSNLPVGLYLVSGERYSVTGTDGKIHIYQPSAYFVCLPYWTDSDGRGEDWVYHLVVDRTKREELPNEPVEQRVIKVWDRGTVPEPVTVELLRNGRVYETVTLSERNNWRYTWTDLDPSYRWEVLERDAGYRVTISQNGGTYRILNSLKEEPKRDDEGGSPPPQEVFLDDPDVPLDQLPPIDPDDPAFDPDEEIELDDLDVPLAELPQTGQLWWPVPLLALAGMAFFLLGWGRHRRGEPDEE